VPPGDERSHPERLGVRERVEGRGECAPAGGFAVDARQDLRQQMKPRRLSGPLSLRTRQPERFFGVRERLLEPALA